MKAQKLINSFCRFSSTCSRNKVRGSVNHIYFCLTILDLSFPLFLNNKKLDFCMDFQCKLHVAAVYNDTLRPCCQLYKSHGFAVCMRKETGSIGFLPLLSDGAFPSCKCWFLRPILSVQTLILNTALSLVCEG